MPVQLQQPPAHAQPAMRRRDSVASLVSDASTAFTGALFQRKARLGAWPAGSADGDDVASIASGATADARRRSYGFFGMGRTMHQRNSSYSAVPTSRPGIPLPAPAPLGSGTLSNPNLPTSAEELRPAWIKEFHVFRECRLEAEGQAVPGAELETTGVLDSQSLEAVNAGAQSTAGSMHAIVPPIATRPRGTTLTGRRRDSVGSVAGSAFGGPYDGASASGSSPTTGGYGGPGTAHSGSTHTGGTASVGAGVTLVAGTSGTEGGASPLPGVSAAVPFIVEPPAATCRVCQGVLEHKVMRCDGAFCKHCGMFSQPLISKVA